LDSNISDGNVHIKLYSSNTKGFIARAVDNILAAHMTGAMPKDKQIGDTQFAVARGNSILTSTSG
jgi:hypothetical protein